MSGSTIPFGMIQRLRFIDGRVQHACLLELFTDAGVGTLIRGRGD